MSEKAPKKEKKGRSGNMGEGIENLLLIGLCPFVLFAGLFDDWF